MSDITSAAQPVTGASGKTRTITGVCTVYGAVGDSSVGQTRFAAGSINIPGDTGRVKLLLDHNTSDPVGYLDKAWVDGDRLMGSFAVAEGDRGDLALSHARARLRDGLSVGCQIDEWHKDGSVAVITGARLNEVSLVAIPAYADARVTDVQSSRKEQKMSDTDTPTTTTTTEKTETVTVTEPTAPPAPQPAPAPKVEAAAPVYTAPRVPAGEDALRQLAAATVEHLKAGNSAMTLQAALADVTPVNVGTPEGPTWPQYVGELWKAAQVARPLLDALGVGTLTSLKMYGFRWKTLPQVQKYAGNKAEIPTNQVARERAEWDAQRFAGGWDIDRVFVDLPGGTDFVRDVYIKAVEDYKTKTEAYAWERVVAEGTIIPTADTVTTPALLSTMAADFGKIRGSRFDIVMMGQSRWESMLNMRDADLPWWVRNSGAVDLNNLNGNAGGIKYLFNPDMLTNDVIAVDSRAVKAQEVDPPVRVNALDLAHGGVDLGVFGYIAVGITDPRLVRIYRKPAA